MKAIVQDRYGPPEVLELRDVAEPQIDDDGVLVRVRASSINPFDWHMMRGTPYIVRAMEGRRAPKVPVRGLDVSGVVERVGANVQELQPGDEVFGHHSRAFAELVAGKEENFVPKPRRISFEQAGGIAVAGFTALQGLRDKADLQAGQKVLITGASGGVGTFAVQIAKAMGAEVTGVCSTPKLELVRSIGADHVIDYTQEDFTGNGKRYDVIFYGAGNHSLTQCRRALTPNGILLTVGRSKIGNWIEPIWMFVKPALVTRFVSQTLIKYLADANKADLLVLKELIDEGKVTPVVDRTYPLEEAAEAVRYQEQGHARGKVIVTA